MKAGGKKGRVENREEAVRDRKAAARVHKDPWGAPHGKKKKSSGQGPQGPLGRTAREEREKQWPGSTRTPGAHRAERERRAAARAHKDPWDAPRGNAGGRCVRGEKSARNQAMASQVCLPKSQEGRGLIWHQEGLGRGGSAERYGRQ